MAAARLDIGRIALALAFACVCLLFGLLSGHDPTLAIGGALAIGFLIVAMSNLTAGLIAFALLAFFALTPGAIGSLISAQAASLVLALSWLARIATRDSPSSLFWSRHPLISWLSVAFLAWVALSSLWAESTGDTFTVLTQYGLDMLLFLIVFEAVRAPAHAKGLLAALVAGGAMAAAYGIVAAPNVSDLASSPTAASSLDRLRGTIADPNQLAAVLVVALVLALALAAVTSSPVRRLLLLGAGGLALVSVFLTASRGGVVGLLAAMVTAIALAGGRRGAAIALALALVCASAIFVGLFDPGVAQRYSTSDGGNGRTDIWKVGWRMVEAHPVRGVGAGNFRDVSGQYLLVEPGAITASDQIIDEPHFAHNVYLEVLAELGVVGLALFMALVGAAIGTGIRAARRFGRAGEADMELLSRAVVVALVSLLAMDFFLSDQFSKQLWLLLALCPALLAIASTRAVATSSESEPARASSEPALAPNA
ncbi:MAG: O-antigen ligase family protein [Solirubrobacterales bacterium]